MGDSVGVGQSTETGCGSRYPPQPVSVLGPAPTLSPTFQWLGYFRAKPFPYDSPTFLKPSSFYTHLPASEDGTECSKMSAYKLQTPENYPKESIKQVWVSTTAVHTTENLRESPELHHTSFIYNI